MPSPAQLQVVVNGETRQVAAGATVADMVVLLAAPRSGVAVAVNGDVVHRGAWSDTRLAEGDRVEVLTAASGG